MLISCSSSSKLASEIEFPNDLKAKLEKQIKPIKLLPEQALSEILKFYRNHPTEDIDGLDDEDWLWFSYGPKESYYELSFKRLLINPENGQQSSICLLMHYELDDFGSLVKYDNWSIDNPDLETWADGIRKTLGFRIASNLRANKYRIVILQE